MKTKELSPKRISRLRTQGYIVQDDQQLAQIAFGNSLAFKFCTGLIAISVATANIPLLSILMCIEFLAIVMPRHPFDFIYNGIVRKWVDRPKLPKRSPQVRFACTMAIVFTGFTVLLFNNDQMVAGYLLGGSLAFMAGLVAFLDLCIPSIIYNALFLSYKRAEPIDETLKRKIQ